jgi:hypothetical protein
MRFYFPDSQDQVDPNFDFSARSTSPTACGSATTVTPTRCWTNRPTTGCSSPRRSSTGTVKGAGKYTGAQRRRLYDLGVHRFFRWMRERRPLDSLGDCGAFAYIEEEEPPITVDDAIDFYDGCGFDAGSRSTTSSRRSTASDPGTLRDRRASSRSVARWERRVEITLENAASSSSGTGARLHVRAGRERAGLEPVLLRRLGRGNSRRWATPASRSAAWSR